MFAIRITSAMCDDFELDQVVPVFAEPPNDDDIVRSEADFDIAALAVELRQWRKHGWTEDEFREVLREHLPIYADVEFPALRSWLTEEHAQALVELGVAEPIVMGELEDALEAWGMV